MKPIGLLLFLVFIANQALALPNPAAVYCEILGFEYKKVQTPAGEKGVVVVEPGVQFDAWDFFKGKVGNDYSFGALYGYDTQCIRTNIGTCILEYAVCVPKGQIFLKSAGRIPLKEFMEQKGVPLFDETLDREKKASSNEDVPANREEDMLGIYDVMAEGKMIPAAFDWRTNSSHTYIGPIRDQGSCGSCYAFAAAAAAEGTYNWVMGKYDGNCADFSESYIIWCLGRLPQYNSHFYGCNGADYDYAELTALTTEGICSETDFPYTETDPGSCEHWSDPVTVFSEWHRIPCSDIEAIKTAIMTYGVVDAAVYASDSFQSYSGGIFSDTSTNCSESPCYYTSVNHAIALVGWDDNPPEGGAGCWILRNSWNTDWGEDGYMRIRYHAARVACEACYLIFLGSNTHTLAVTSAHDGAYPPAGVMTNNHGVSITCSITNSPVINGTTQFVCMGWSGSGSVPVTGSSTNTGSFALTNDSAIIWLWRTNFDLSAPTGVSASDGTLADKVLVTWNSVANATGYTVWRSGMNTTNSAELIGASITTTNHNDTTAVAGVIYYYWVKATHASDTSAFSASDSGWRTEVLLGVSADYDGDGKADPAVYVGSTEIWYIKLSASGYDLVTLPFGGTGYTAVFGDFDGDGKADPAVYDSVTGHWQIKLSASGYAVAAMSGFGGASYQAVAGDYDGDGKADPAIYNTASGDWLVAMSSLGYGVASAEGFGGTGYTTVQENYDSDNRTDAAIYNSTNGNWTVLLSASSYITATLWGFGGTGYAPVSGDFDGDGWADPATYQESTATWSVNLSGSGYATATLTSFGGTGYQVSAADYDGDGLADPTLFDLATGIWHIKLSASGYATATLASGYTP